MPEYIEREKFRNILEAKAEMAIGTPKEVFYNAVKMLELIPTADVVEVRHGEWIAVPSSDMSTGKAFKCSKCQKMRYGVRLPPYCQECGAKMDGKGG